MKSVTAKIDIGAAHIQDRLKLLAASHSQSELARRTGVPFSNVNRYVSGEARVPAEFCGALVKNLGVNPAWLLTGEGAVMLADVTAGTAQMGGDMLELVEALNAVSRMRLGSLTGKHHLAVLRGLNDALGTYESLRKRLNERSGPILSQLISDMNRSAGQLQLEQAADLRKAALQIAQFCHDPELLRALRASESTLEYALGNIEGALQMSREVFARTLTRTDQPNKNALIQAHNLAASLCQNFRFKEARRVLKMALAMGEEMSDMEAYHEVRTLLGIVEMETGQIDLAAPHLMAAWPQTTAPYRQGAQGLVQRALVLSGMVSFAQVREWGAADPGRARQIVRLAIWFQSPTELAQVQREHIGTEPGQLAPTVLESVQVGLLLKASGSKRGKFDPADQLARAEAARLPEPIAAMLRNVYAAQSLALAGERKAAAKAVREAEETRNALEELSPDFLTAAMHWRNALAALEPCPLREQAREFMVENRRRGYSILPAA